MSQEHGNERGQERGRGGPFISVIVNNSEVQRRPLDKAIVIGRSLDCDLWLEDNILSRHHCRLEPDAAGGWAVVDLDSRNGTFVNATRLKNRRVLKDGDIVTVGRAHIRFRAGGYAPPRIPPTPIPRDPNAETLGLSDSMISKTLPFTRPRPQPKPRVQNDHE